MALFLSDVLILHVLGFRQFKTRWIFRPSFLENARHVICPGANCWKSGIGMKKCLSGLKNFDLRAIATGRRLPIVRNLFSHAGMADGKNHGNCSGRLGTLALASRNGPRTHNGAMAVRMIENAKTAEFTAVAAISDHELT